MSEGKEVARRIADWMNDEKGFLIDNESEDMIAEAFDALNITFAPPVPEGSVKVRIAVACSNYGDAVSLSSPIGFANESACVECLKARHHVSTNVYADHAAIVEAWIPPVTPVPTVSGRVV